MKSTSAMHSEKRHQGRSANGSASDRAGSILIAVLWLMALLWVLGIFFFLFANTEQTSATIFSDASKVDNRCGIDPDVLWDVALRQLIVGPKFDEDGDGDVTTGVDSEQESALYGHDQFNQIGVGPHSLLAHWLGKDLQPYTGRGINLIADSSNPGMPLVDQDYDGTADGDQSLLEFIYSSSAWGGTAIDLGVDLSSGNRPAIDVGYTYPDINSPFLAYIAPPGPGPDGAPGQVGIDDDGANGIDDSGEMGWTGSDDTPRIIIPSFHRPQYLRQNGAPVSQITNWDRDPLTIRQVFRAHIEHQTLDNTNTAYFRYLATTSAGPDGQPGIVGIDDDGAGGIDDAGELGWPGSDDVLPFEFSGFGPDGQPGVAGVDDDLANGIDDNGEFGWTGSDDVRFREGVWTQDFQTVANKDVYQYSYDVDADGDGIKEAVYIPLAFPIQACDGKRFIPMFAFTVVDADGLINLNAAGNTSGINITGTLNPSGPNRFHRSNQALTPSEISLQYALDGIPDTTVSTGDPRWEYYNKVFNIADPLAVTRQEMANMDTFALLYGRGEYDATLSLEGTLLGRYGDRDQLINALSTVNPADFPKPGRYNVDDDQDQDVVSSNDPANTVAYNHPLEVSGAGSFIQSSGFGGFPARPDIGSDPNRWIQYSEYDITTQNVGYDNSFPNLLTWTTGAPTQFQVDEADEMVLESGFPVMSGNDAAFGVEEMAGLHKSDADPDANLVVSRLKDLLINFKESLGAADRRKQFTSISWDRIEMGLQRSTTRPWETSTSFPPLVSTLASTDLAQPFRQTGDRFVANE